MAKIKKIILEIKFYFFSTFQKFTVGGLVNQLIKKFWPLLDVMFDINSTNNYFVFKIKFKFLS